MEWSSGTLTSFSTCFCTLCHSSPSYMVIVPAVSGVPEPEPYVTVSVMRRSPVLAKTVRFCPSAFLNSYSSVNTGSLALSPRCHAVTAIFEGSLTCTLFAACSFMSCHFLPLSTTSGVLSGTLTLPSPFTVMLMRRSSSSAKMVVFSSKVKVSSTGLPFFFHPLH